MSEGKKTVLIVDDNAYIRSILSHHLQTDGYETAEAANGVAGLDRAFAGGVDLILLDVMMPEMDGLEFLKKLRAAPSTAELPVVMVSAYGQRENVMKAVKEGANGFIVKPFTRDVILEKVRATLGQ